MRNTIILGLFILIAGAIAFICAIYFLEPKCSLEQIEFEYQGLANGQQTPDSKKSKNTSNNFSFSFNLTKSDRQKPNTSEVYRDDSWNPKGWGKQFLCEAKVWDVAISYFTFCLVVVGGFTMYSVDATAKRTERAYLVCGSLLGKKKRKQGSIQEQRFPVSDDFTEPRRLTVHNYGKTVAYVSKIEFGFYPYRQYFKGLTVSQIIDWLALGDDIKIEIPNHSENVIPPTDRSPFFIRQVERIRSEHVGEVFFGRVSYKDVFGESHYCTFQYLLTANHSEPLGKFDADQQ